MRNKIVNTDLLFSIGLSRGTVIHPMMNDIYRCPDGREILLSDLQLYHPEWFIDGKSETEKVIESILNSGQQSPKK